MESAAGDICSAVNTGENDLSTQKYDVFTYTGLNILFIPIQEVYPSTNFSACHCYLGFKSGIPN